MPRGGLERCVNVVGDGSEQSKRTQAHAKAKKAEANQELNNQFLAFLTTRQRVSSPSENENLKVVGRE